MTGVTTGFLISDDADLEDGEIASDEEGEKGLSRNKTPTVAKQEFPSPGGQHEGRPPLGGRLENQSPSLREKADSPMRQGDRRRRNKPNQGPEEEPDRKRKKPSVERGVENEDELLGLCVRGGSPDGDSPIWKPKATGHVDTGWTEEGDDRKRRRMNSPSTKRGTGNFRGVSREERDSRTRMQIKRKMKPQGRKGVADKEVCLNFLKGACSQGADCYYSHNVCQPRIMELCKFYLKDCCMKRDKCLYLHEEFPCKFFHTGLKCYANKKCKFSHEPLNNFTREILVKHMETAPKDILGDFPRMSRENAEAALGGGRFLDGRSDNPFSDERNFGERRRDDNGEQRRPFSEEREFRGGRRENEDEDFEGRTNRRNDGCQDQKGPRDDHPEDQRIPRDEDRRGPLLEDKPFGGGRDEEGRFDDERNFGGRRDGPPDQRLPFVDNFNQRGSEDFNRSKGDDEFRRRKFEEGNDGKNSDFPENRAINPETLGRLEGFSEKQGPLIEQRNFQNPGENNQREDLDQSPGNRRVDRPSPDGPNRFGRGHRGRKDDENGPRKRGDHDDRRRGNRDEDGGRFGRNFGPEGRNFNMAGPNNNRPGRNFNFDGPGGRGFNNNESSKKRNFDQDGPRDERFGPNDQRGENRGRNFGPEGPNFNNFGPNNHNFGPGGPMPHNFVPNMQNFGPNLPNFNFGPNFGSNFGPNQQDFSNQDREFNPVPNDRSGTKERNGPQDQWRGDRGKRGRRRGGHHEGDNQRRHEDQMHSGLDRRERGPRKLSGGETDEPSGPKPQPKPFSQPNDDSNNSGTSSPFDFAKELAEYKNKKLEMEIQKKQQEEAEANVVIEKGPELIPPEERLQIVKPSEYNPVLVMAEEVEEQKEPDPAATFPPPYTQVYPPFPTEEQGKEKKEGGSKKHHHHHKKKKKHSELEHDDRKKSRKERKEKKRQPVIVQEDGSFGGIKFKIKLNPGKDDKREIVTSHRRPNEFMSSDDEIPLNYLQKRKDDGDETDTECRLVIETNEQPEDKSSFEKEELTHYPRHLPKRQQELFLRIQSHQNQSPVADETSRRSGSPGDRTPTPEPTDENWYSSDDEGAGATQPPTLMRPEEKPQSVELRGSTGFPQRSKSSNEDIPQQPIRSTTPPGHPPAQIQPKIELAALKDLSKINITELLSSIRQITGSKAQSVQEPSLDSNKLKSGSEEKIDPRVKDTRDPRLGNASPKETKIRRGSGEEKPPYAKSIYEVTTPPGSEVKKDLDLRFRLDVDDRAKEANASTSTSSPGGGFGDVDLRILGDGPLPALKLGLPFKPAPMHTAATEIEASLASHPPIDYKVTPIQVPPPNFTNIKISPDDPLVKKDPRLRRLFRVSSAEEPKPDEPKKLPTIPMDPRRKVKEETPKSPQQDTPFSPPQEPPHFEPATPRLTPNLLALVQLGLSAAAGGAAFDPRLRSLVPQDLEALRAVVAGLRPEDIETIRAMEGPQGAPEGMRPPGQGLLPTPTVPGMGLLPTPSFIMNSMMPMDSMMVGPMGPIPGPMGPMGPLNPMGPFGFEPPTNDADMRMYRGGFKGDRRGGRGNWRGGSRDRNWGDRRHRDREDRGRNRDKDDRRERRSYSPTE